MQTIKAIPPSQDAEPSAMFERIRQILAPPAVGVWYQPLRKIVLRSKIEKWRAAGPVVADQDYCELFGFASIDQFPHNRRDLIHTDHIASIEQAIMRAKNGPVAEVQECAFRIVITSFANGKTLKRVKWLFARIGKFYDGFNHYLICWNSDVTSLKEKEQFYEKVLAVIPGFVFLKSHQFTNDSRGHRFEFRYCNKPLEQALPVPKTRALEIQKRPPVTYPGSSSDLERPNYFGMTDFDYFPEDQAEAFFKTDMKAFHEASVPTVVPEEQFQPRESDSELSPSKTLTTVKTRFDTIDNEGNVSQCVLGVAVDLSSVTQLLKSAMERCTDALFVKNMQGRYVYVNQHFRRFLGVGHNVRVEGRTLREILTDRYTGLGRTPPPRCISLIERVENEDHALVDGDKTNISADQVAFFSDDKRWTVKKERLCGAGDPVCHILGVARHALDQRDLDNQIIKNSPHFICIKDSQLRVMYCNWKFAERRGMTVQQCFNKTDFDFWPQEKFPGQAERFQAKDQEVLALLPELEEIDSDPSLDEQQKRELRRLKLERFTSYPEHLEVEVAGRNGTRKETRLLLTTKWPDRINGQPVLHVAYADVTETSEQAERWHRYTFHAIGNELTQFEMALIIVKDLLKSDSFLGAASRQKVSDIYHCLVAGRAGMKFYVDHHLKFMRGKCDLTRQVDIARIVDERIQEMSLCPFEYAQLEETEIEEAARHTITYGDEVFLRAAISEMMRNALKATQRRFGSGYNDSAALEHPPSISKGRIKVTCRLRDRADKIDRKCIVVSVRDEGDGTSENSEGRRLLDAAIERMKRTANLELLRNRELAYPDTSGGFGLRFLFSVAQDHKGVFNIKPDSDHVESHLVIPV